MVTMLKSPPPVPGKPPEAGHCSKCRKIWVLNERQGVCPWCGKLSNYQTKGLKPRHIKFTSRRKPRQDNGNGHNGYDQLTGEWSTYYNVAVKHATRAKLQEQEDLLHTIILTLARAERNNGHKPFTLGTMHRIASRTVFDYWRAYHRLHNGIDCHVCSKAQKRKCREYDNYSECPKAIKLESLNKPIIDSEGNITELGDTIADPESLDPEIWDRGYLWQLGYKPRLVEIALKLHKGEALTHGELCYLSRFRKQEQKRLFE